MNLLLLIYAMLAGLTGFTAGPSAAVRTAAVAETGSLVPTVAVARQASIAIRALTARAGLSMTIPRASVPDARRVAATLPAQPLVALRRAAPERRLE
jgi:hypothetical protein